MPRKDAKSKFVWDRMARIDAALADYAAKNPSSRIAKLTAKQAAKLAKIKAEKIRTAAGMVC